MPDSLPRSKPGCGKKLLEALTRDQTETLLDILADTGALLRLPEELRAVDSDLADTVQRLVGKADISAMNSPDEVVSNRKLLETWYDLWGRWNSHVCEVGDEEGDYVIKDADWEPPYFDPTALADDLEKIAKEMRPMLEPVSGLIDDPELFMKAADEIEDNIRARVYADLSRANFAPKRDEFTFHMAPDSSSVRAGIRSCGLPSFVRETSGKRLELRRTVDCCRDFPW